MHERSISTLKSLSTWSIYLSIYLKCSPFIVWVLYVCACMVSLLTYWLCMLNDKEKIYFYSYRTSASVIKLFLWRHLKKRTLQHASSTSPHPQPHGFFLFHFMEAVFFAENLPFSSPPQSPKGGWTLWGQPYLQTMAAPLICTTDHVCWRATAECFWRKTDLTLTIIFW